MTRRGLWNEEEKCALSDCMESDKNYIELARKLGRSLWAVECQVIKLSRERGQKPEDNMIAEASVEKYDLVNKSKAEKASLELDEKRLHVRALNALLDLTDIKATLRQILQRLDELES